MPEEQLTTPAFAAEWRRLLAQLADESRAKPATLMTIPEVAELLGVDRRTIERWASARRIPGRVQLSARAVRHRAPEVSAWIEAGCPVTTDN